MASAVSSHLGGAELGKVAHQLRDGGLCDLGGSEVGVVIDVRGDEDILRGCCRRGGQASLRPRRSLPVSSFALSCWNWPPARSVERTFRQSLSVSARTCGSFSEPRRLPRLRWSGLGLHAHRDRGRPLNSSLSRLPRRASECSTIRSHQAGFRPSGYERRRWRSCQRTSR